MHHHQFFSHQFVVHEENQEASHRLGTIYRVAAWYIFGIVSTVLYFTGFATVVPWLWNWHGLYYLAYLLWTVFFSILVALAIMALVRFQLTQMHIVLVERVVQQPQQPEPVSSEPPPSTYTEGYHIREESPVIVDAAK